MNTNGLKIRITNLGIGNKLNLIFFTVVLLIFLINSNDAIGFAWYVSSAVLIAIVLKVTDVYKKCGTGGVLRAPSLYFIAGLYVYVLIEFMFPQNKFLSEFTQEQIKNGFLVIVATFFILMMMPTITISGEQEAEKYTNLYKYTFIIISIVVFIPYLMRASFDPAVLYESMISTRFEKIVVRGRYGTALDAITELTKLQPFIFALSGLIFANHKKYRIGFKVYVLLVFSYFILDSFFSGTRNEFISYFVAFFIAYIIQRERKVKLSTIVFSIAILVLLLFATQLLLHYRTSGVFVINEEREFFIDQNFRVVALVVEKLGIFGTLSISYLYLGLVKIIPRFLWESKPVGANLSFEELVGVDPSTVTLAGSFIGEAYSDFGYIGIMVYVYIMYLISYFLLKRACKTGDKTYIIFAIIFMLSISRSLIYISQMILIAGIYAILSRKLILRSV